MKILTLSGSVPISTNLPKFKDVFTHLIEPSKIITYDSFAVANGSINGKPLPYSKIGALVWAASAQADCVASTDGGYIAPTGTSDRNITVNAANANGAVMGRFRWGASLTGAIGLLFRYASQDNTMRAVMTSSTVSIQVRLSGVTSTIASVSFTPEINTLYDLKVEFDDDDVIKLYINGTLYIQTGTSEHNAQTKSGVYFTGLASHRCLSFGSGSL